MMLARDVGRVMDLYPKIFFACHTRHVPDKKTGRILSAHQARILDHLDSLEPTSLTDLARHSGVTAGTMSLAIERLVRRGYVLRSRDARDGRRVNLRVSASGLRIKDSHSVLDAARVRAVLARLSAPEREEGVRGLAILAAAAEKEMAGGGWTGGEAAGRARA